MQSLQIECTFFPYLRAHCASREQLFSKLRAHSASRVQLFSEFSAHSASGVQLFAYLSAHLANKVQFFNKNTMVKNYKFSHFNCLMIYLLCEHLALILELNSD